MRVMCLAIIAGAVCAAGPALADAITYNIAFTGNQDIGSTPYGPLFDPALGTLTGLSITITGTVQVSIFTMLTNAPTSVNIDGFIDILGFRGPVTNDGTYTLTQIGSVLTGPPEPFSFTQSTSDAGAMYDYTASPGDYKTGLANLDVFPLPPFPNAWGVGADPESEFSGNFAITYTYDVPEPDSLAMLALGVVLLSFARPTRKQRLYRPAPTWICLLR